MNDPSCLVTCLEVAHTFGSGPTALVAVHGATCTVAAGDRIAIAGPSGSGKSTLLHLMAGLEAPTHGTLSWPALPTPPLQRARAIGVVFQSPSLIPTLSVAENVALPLALAGVDDATARLRVGRCLEQVDATGLANRLPDELSGGQAQRVAVARVLAQQPLLILADEPTGQLDHSTGQRVLDALLAAADMVNAAVVVTTHDPAVIERLRTRWTMDGGRLHTGRLPAGAVAVSGSRV